MHVYARGPHSHGLTVQILSETRQGVSRRRHVDISLTLVNMNWRAFALVYAIMVETLKKILLSSSLSFLLSLSLSVSICTNTHIPAITENAASATTPTSKHAVGAMAAGCHAKNPAHFLTHIQTHSVMR